MLRYGSPIPLERARADLHSATIFDHLSNSPEKVGHKKALAVFFFNFHNHVEQTVEGFLSSVLVQLWAYLPLESSPTALLLGDVRVPSSEDLLNCLIKTLSLFEDVYIMLDALDECSLDVRRKFLSMITQLRNYDDSSLHLLISSRRNIDLQEALRALYPLEISIDAECIVNDVKRYVQTEVQRSEKLRFFESLEPQIVDTVVQKSQGM